MNTSQVTYERNDGNSEVRVNNFLCYQDGNILSKVTEIFLPDRVIRIEDKLEFDEKNENFGGNERK